MTRKVAVYARVSTEHEAQLSALDNQVQYYDDILKQHPDWYLYKKYIDEGITGTSIKKRKEFMSMLEDAKNGCFDLIITREVSRFARNTVDTLQVTRRLKQIGVEVYFTEDNIWTFKDEDGELKLTIMATLAQNESKKISQRVKAGMKISFENGVVYGTGNILGYDRVGKEMVVNPIQAQTVKFIYNEYLNGNCSKTIADKLESLGYLTATGLTRWEASSVVRILKNSFYTGTIVYRKQYVPDYLEQKKINNHGEVEKIIVEGKHEPIISKEDFNRVQEMMREHSIIINGNTIVGKKIPLSVWGKKLIFECGSTFNRRRYHITKAGGIRYCYVCYNKKKNGSKKFREAKGLDTSTSCDIRAIPESKLRLMFYYLFSYLIQNKKEFIELVKKELNNDEGQNKQIELLDNFKKLKQDNLNKNSKLTDLYLNNYVDKEEYLNRKGRIDDELKIIDERIIELNKKIEINTKEYDFEKILSNLLIYDNLENYEDLVDKLISQIIVKGDNIFEWKINLIDEVYNLKINGKGKSSYAEFCTKNVRLVNEGTSFNQRKESTTIN